MNAELLAFAGVMALGQFSPGPDMILVTRTSLRSGVKAGMATACGIASALTIHMTLVVAGMAVILESSRVLKLLFGWAAAAYLLWLAFKILRETFRSGGQDGKVDQPEMIVAGRPFRQGFLCNLLNPKVVIILAALGAPFLTGSHPSWWPMALWCIVVFQGLTLWVLWANLLQWRPLKKLYEKSSRWIDAAFGLVLVVLAIRLAVGI